MLFAAAADCLIFAAAALRAPFISRLRRLMIDA